MRHRTCRHTDWQSDVLNEQIQLGFLELHKHARHAETHQLRCCAECSGEHFQGDSLTPWCTATSCPIEYSFTSLLSLSLQVRSRCAHTCTHSWCQFVRATPFCLPVGKILNVSLLVSPFSGSHNSTLCLHRPITSR